LKKRPQWLAERGDWPAFIMREMAGSAEKMKQVAIAKHGGNESWLSSG